LFFFFFTLSFFCPLLFSIFHKQSYTTRMRERSEHLLWWLCVGVCICWFNKCWSLSFALFAMITKTPWTFACALQLLFYSCHLKLQVWVLHLNYFCLQVFLFLNALLCYMLGESSWKPYLHFLCCFLKVKLCDLATRYLGVCFAYFCKNLSLGSHI
jgi:hypothetical protein